MQRTTGSRLLLLLSWVFVFSGFSALIYQSIWTHYLGLVLGHAAYAQTLVLTIFMGGMAGGAWLVSRISHRIQRLVVAYAAIEALLAIFGAAFHPIFTAYSRWSLQEVLPNLPDGWAASAWQWSSAALLIAPQTLLLGATFPLIASAVLRVRASADGEALGQLYFANSIGAAIGVLCATFLLLPAWGKPGALAVAAGINACLALVTWWLSREQGPSDQPATTATAPTGRPPVDGKLARLLMAATFFSSAASFGYEIGWVRMLNQALGTTLHGFELMLAAFITGMALGGLWVRKRAAAMTDVVAVAGYVQMAMGVSALLSVPVLAGSFHWVSWLHGALAPSDSGYLLYSLATAGIAFVVMAPAAFFAGMTLPLYTAALLRQGHGERVIGQVYAANTLGAILGVLITTHVLIPLMGISLSVVTAATVDVVIGVVLLRGWSPGRWSIKLVLAVTGGILVFSSVVRLGLPSASLQASGVFRHGRINPTADVQYYRDGATASIAVTRNGSLSVIATNGKPDAGLTAVGDEPSSDEVTMAMLGALPLAAHPNPQRVALIGWGSGISTHTLLGSPKPIHVDTIEIEKAMWEGAKLFRPRNERAYDDPRSHLRLEDARRLFGTAGERYDVIVSEPSNPWVSGVASLFTKEFYNLVRQRLKPDGLLVQWIHLYEMSDDLLAQMVAAVLVEFPHAELYLTNYADIVILAGTQPLPALRDEPWRHPALAAELKRVGLGSVADMQVRRIGGTAALRTYVRQYRATPHSDFHPTVALEAPKHRFGRREARFLTQLVTLGVPVLQVLECRPQPDVGQPVLPDLFGQLARLHADANDAVQVLLDDGDPRELFRRNRGVAETVAMLRGQRKGALGFDPVALREQLGVLAGASLGFLNREQALRLWDASAWQRDLPQMSAAHRAQIELYAAFAAANWPLVRQQAEFLLGPQGGNATPVLREQYLLLGTLAAMALGERDAVGAWERRHAQAAPPSSLASLRRFLRAWDGQEPVCAAHTAAGPAAR